MQRVFGIEFCPLSQSELVDALTHDPVPPGAGPRRIETANLDHIVHLTSDAEFRAAYDAAWRVTADGTPVYLFAKLRGAGVPQRVTGSDLFGALMPSLMPHQHRCFFVASEEVTARRLESYLLSRGFPADSLAIEVPPHGFEADRFYSEHLAHRIHDHRTTHLFVGVGAPKSAIWTHRYERELGDCYVLNIGAGLDFFAGVKQRAPHWARAIGMEWLWRFLHEPRRLFRRYFVDSWHFVGAIRHDLSR